jgi:hypothetical protein
MLQRRRLGNRYISAFFGTPERFEELRVSYERSMALHGSSNSGTGTSREARPAASTSTASAKSVPKSIELPVVPSTVLNSYIDVTVPPPAPADMVRSHQHCSAVPR